MHDPSPFAGWVPIRVEWRPGGPELDWCYLGERTFREPFYEHTIRAHLQSLYNLTERRRGSMAELVALADARPALPLAGLIFHMSRCGSTLISSLLATSPTNLVISEAPPIDDVLDLRRRGVPDETLVAWLRAIVAALLQPRSGAEQRAVIKLDSWHILDLPLFQRAFPGVPWLFVYREPVEVIVSHQRQRGMQMAPGQIAPARLGLADADVRPPFNLDEFCARVLGNYCAAAARFIPAQGGKPLNYSQLPAALWSTVAPAFGIPIGAAEREEMELALPYHAKYPGTSFAPDAAAKRAAATPTQVQLAERYVRPAYEQLERLRAR